MKDTFSPEGIPEIFLGEWGRVQSSCEQASAQEKKEWEDAERVWKRGAGQPWSDHEEFTKARETFLEALVKTTRPSFNSAQEFWSSSTFEGDDCPERRVYVPDEVMDGIDKIYVRHYHTTEAAEGPRQHHLCLSCERCNHASGENGIRLCKSTLLSYLADVKCYLKDLQLTDLPQQHPHQAGVANATIRLEPLNTPIGVLGRLTLPLPTREMLQDLWDLVFSACNDLVREVCHARSLLRYMPLNHSSQISLWFDGLGPHMIMRKGGKGSVENRTHVYADVIRQKLCSLSEDDFHQKALVSAVRMSSQRGKYKTHYRCRCSKRCTLNIPTLRSWRQYTQRPSSLSPSEISSLERSGRMTTPSLTSLLLMCTAF